MEQDQNFGDDAQSLNQTMDSCYSHWSSEETEVQTLSYWYSIFLTFFILYFVKIDFDVESFLEPE